MTNSDALIQVITELEAEQATCRHQYTTGSQVRVKMCELCGWHSRNDDDDKLHRI